MVNRAGAGEPRLPALGALFRARRPAPHCLLPTRSHLELSCALSQVRQSIPAGRHS